MITDGHRALLKEWCKQWNLAEKAMKIAEKANEEYQAPSVLELRYSGRKVVEFFDLLEEPNALHNPEDKLKDAIYDCHRARHDATDHATSVIAERLDTARAKFGAEAVRTVFPDYAALIAELSKVREIIATSREQRNGRGQFYSQIEADHLPKIMQFFETFKAAEPELERNFLGRSLANFGMRYGWILAILLAVLAWVFPLSPS